MSKSIMHSKEDGTCYLCIKLHSNYARQYFLQEHHVAFGTANRRLSEKYGLKVYLCDAHHEHSDEAVHVNAEVRILLCEDAQRAFEKKYPNLSFRCIFGKNYIEAEKGSSIEAEKGSSIGEIQGFTFIRGLDEETITMFGMQ